MGHFQGQRRPLGGFISNLFAKPEPPRRNEREEAADRLLLEQIGRLNRKMEKIMTTLDEVLERVYEQRGQINSLAMLTRGIRHKLEEALAGALSPAQQAKVDAVFTELDKNTAAISKAVRANDDDASNDDPVDPPVGNQSGSIDPGPVVGELPKADDPVLVDGEKTEPVVVPPANELGIAPVDSAKPADA